MSKYIKLTFLGDIMCKEQMINTYKEGDNYNFDTVFGEVKEYLKQSDFVFGNLETPISENNSSLTAEEFCFNSPKDFAQSVKDAGIDFVSTANNHCLDRGIEGISSTIRCLDDIGFYHTGIFDNEKKVPLVVNIDNIKIGILSYTYGTNAFSNHNYLPFKEYWRVNLFQNQELSNPIRRKIDKKYHSVLWYLFHAFVRIFCWKNERCAEYDRKEFAFRCRRRLNREIALMKKKQPDFIVMYMHAGGQYNKEAKKETKKLVEYCLKKGIHIVVGSHEHVVHGGIFSKMVDNKLATYSLGNFNGIAGIYAPPYDKKAEYSIAWNVYINKNEKKIVKSTYSILKTIPDNSKVGGIKTIPVYDLLINNYSKDLWDEVRSIAYTFSGKDISDIGIQMEYEL